MEKEMTLDEVRKLREINKINLIENAIKEKLNEFLIELKNERPMKYSINEWIDYLALKHFGKYLIDDKKEK